MLPDRVSNPGPLTYESGALPIAATIPVSWLFVLVSFGSCGLTEPDISLGRAPGIW